MIDAILYIKQADSFFDLSMNPSVINVTGERLHYVRTTAAQLNEWRPHVTVLAEAPYTGTGTAERVYQQIQDDAEKLAVYKSVYVTTPREIEDGEGGTMKIMPPFKFGMLAESTLPVPESVTSRQGMQQLIIAGLDEQVETAIAGIADPVERKLTQAWFQRATDWERDNPQFIGLMKELGLTDQEADDHMRAAAQL